MSNSGSDSCNITHPIVDCFVGEVRVRALLDTGSTKSIISNTVHQIIDFNGTAINLSQRPQCISISGHNLNIIGQINSNLKFINCKHPYSGDFLVSDNIPYECVLGWDFITRNNLVLKRDSQAGYLLVGPHGNTPIRVGQESMTASLAAGFEKHVLTDRFLCQSTFKSNSVVTLVDDAMIPPRTEIILGGKLTRSVNGGQIGIIAPNVSIGNDTRQGFSLAHVVVKPDHHRIVPLRVLNMSNSPTELAAGENIAEFCPLVESWRNTPTACIPNICGASRNENFHTFTKRPSQS